MLDKILSAQLFAKVLAIGIFFFSQFPTQAAAEGLTATSQPIPLTPFTLENTQGESISSEQYQGQVLLVNFWASWCPPCVAEFPSLQELKTHFKDAPFEILAINMGEPLEAIEHFAADLSAPINFPLLIDEHIVAAKAWRVKGLPTTLVLNKRGEAVLSFTGERDWNDKQAHTLVNQLLNE